MSSMNTLKRNIEKFFHAKGYEYGYDSEDIDNMLAEIRYEDLYDAIQNQERPVYEHTEFESYSDMLNGCVQDKCITDATLLFRVMVSENDDFSLSSRRYLELWIDDNMDLQIISCFESLRGYNSYVTQYREILDPVWPDEETSLEIEDLSYTLTEMCWSTNGNDAIPIFEEWE